MKTGLLKYILGAEAVICIAGCVLGLRLEGAFSSLMAFPLEQLGMGLRLLSLSGSAGNAAALVLYFAVCLLPVLWLAIRAVKKRLRGEDVLLALMSLLLFAALYLMINPFYISQHFGGSGILDIGKSLIGCCVWSLLIAYLILRLLRRFDEQAETPRLLRWMQMLLWALAMLLVFDLFGSGLSELITAFQALFAGNTALTTDFFGNFTMSETMTISCIFLLLQQLTLLLPTALGLPLVRHGLALLKALETEPYSDTVICAAEKLGAFARKSIVAILVSQVVLNLLQFMAGSRLLRSSLTLHIPLGGILLTLAALLLARYFQQGKQLKDDNDMFI